MTPTTTDTQHNLADLEEQRQKLAYLATEGDLAAVERLDAVEAEILRIHRDAERRDLAERERQRRDADERAEQERQRIAALESRARALGTEQLDAAREFDVAADVLAEKLARLVSVGADLYAVRTTLRPSGALHRLPGLITASLQWRLAGMLPDIGRAPHAYRKPLVELLGGTTTTPEA